MFEEPTEMLLIGCLTESIWIPRSISNALTPKNQLADILTKGTSHVMNGIIFCVCLTLAISVLPIVLKWCRKNTKRIRWRKSHSKVKTNDKFDRAIQREGSERACLDSIRKPGGRPDSKVKVLWVRKLRSTIERWKPVVCRDTSHERHRPVENAHSSSYSEWNIDQTWSSQKWKSDELMDDRTERPVVCPPGGAHASQTRFSREHKNVIVEEEENHDRTLTPVVCRQGGAHQFAIGDDETESELSLGSRSFLHRVNDQLWKKQKQSSIDATENNEKHSVIWWMFMPSTLQASVFMGENYSDNWHSIKIHKISQWNRCSTYLKSWYPNNQMRSMEWIQNNWSDSAWKHVSLIGDEEVVSLSRAKVYYVFSDSVLCLGKMSENPLSNVVWEDKLTWFKSSSENKVLDTMDGEPMEFEWNIFPGFTTLQLCCKVQEFLSKMSVEPEDFHRTDHLHVDVQRLLMVI